ncbi:MAG: UDP-N-acetylmuramoylalanine--D-glutamate ligase [bacterium]|nr:UDP-N-acetylmuramoylalanine--D-glutamate ligase [bacterium]
MVGLGLSGAAAAAFLARRGHSVLAVDQADTPALRGRAAELADLGVEVRLGIPELPTEVDQVVTSPGVPPERLEVYRERKIPVLGELEIGCREIRAPIVAVTGTNGKSTVVTNIAKGLADAGKRAVAIGNLGTPITEWVDREEAADCVVLEVSSYQLETIVEFRPHVGVVLNIAPDHLSHHGTMEAYVTAKSRISMNQSIDDVLLLHRDLSEHQALQKTRGRLYWYGQGLPPSRDGLSLAGGVLRWHGGEADWSREIKTETLLTHEIDNLLACVATLHLLGVSADSAVRLFRDWIRLPHRIERVAEVGGVTYINDSKATNAHAAIAALRAIPGGLVWLVGGEGKGEDLSDLVVAARGASISSVICFGRDREVFRAAFSEDLKVEVRDTLREAFDLAAAVARPGETVLLSPACASFDEFNSFEDRGDQFRGWVAALQEARS